MTKTIKDVIAASYNSIYEFNDIAGNLQGNSYDQINNQLSFCFEELEETIKAFEEGSPVDLLKEALDLWVVSAGLLQKLEAAGFNVAEAMSRVDTNNLSKYPPYGQPLQFKIGYLVSKNDKYQRYVLKNDDGKVMKPSNYQKVDLSDCVPSGFFKG